MLKQFILFFCILSYSLFYSQSILEKETKVKQDSIKKKVFVQHLGNGYFPTKYFNFDLRYLIKYNQYEGIRTGLGCTTNDAFSEKYRINSYTVYGFRDDHFKYSIGGSFRISELTNTWFNFSYTDDLQETGSTKFLTDKRFFQFFEPRLLNIDLFHKHITKTISIEHEINDKLSTETEFTISKIDPTYSYGYAINGDFFNNFNLSTAKISFQWNPFDSFKMSKTNVKQNKKGFPKFTLQYTKKFSRCF